MKNYLIEKNGDTYYTGPLDAGLVAAAKDRVIKSRHEYGAFTVHLCDSNEWNDTAEWGRGKTLEDASRFALGALFGPMDSEYDPGLLHNLVHGEE